SFCILANENSDASDEDVCSEIPEYYIPVSAPSLGVWCLQRRGSKSSVFGEVSQPGLMQLPGGERLYPRPPVGTLASLHGVRRHQLRNAFGTGQAVLGGLPSHHRM
ncbi:hypothetical protein T310_9217, partial [Rasamsonia emersonii CBS 393.64]